MKYFLLCFALGISSQGAFATITGPIVREGYVHGFDEKNVTLISPEGKKFVVPRDSIAEHFKIAAGLRVESVMEGKELMARLKASEAEAKKIKKATK